MMIFCLAEMGSPSEYWVELEKAYITSQFSQMRAIASEKTYFVLAIP
jgi:hypothetical protein